MNQILTSRTLDSIPGGSQDQKGSFKLTHLAPTSDTLRYAIYFGLNDSHPVFVSLPKDNSAFTWKTFDTTALNYVHGVINLSVDAGKTTFYTNYEHEK
jgi:hypothetical protein